MKISTIFHNRVFRKLFIIIMWLIILEVVSLFVDNSILLVGPAQIIKTLCINMTNLEFYISVAGSFFYIALGFFIGAFLGIFLGIISNNNHIIEDFLSPAVSFLKSVPVASFVVLFLIWWHSRYLSIAICICVIFPQFYVSTLNSLKNIDIKLCEMARVFNLNALDYFNYIIRPALCRDLEATIKVSAGMAIKSGIAAEVIGTPDNTIGASLYMSKIFLDTAGVLSWTIVIIIIGVFFERVLVALLNRYSRLDLKCIGVKRNKLKNLSSLLLSDIKLSYDNKIVIDGYTKELTANKITILSWPSGEGKTTLLNILAGILKCDSGSITPNEYSVSMVFQEDRLIESFSAIKNIELISGDINQSRNILIRLLNEDELNKPVSELSGGQRRRVAIARALCCEADLLILDEPYKGLDEKNIGKVKAEIDNYSNNKIVIIATHINP